MFIECDRPSMKVASVVGARPNFIKLAAVNTLISEWVETVETGANILTDTNTVKIIKAVKEWMPPSTFFNRRPTFGDGKTSEKITYSLMNELSTTSSQ
jgi:UDP-N-acetylglucosamine 2-epimerase